MRRSQSHLLPVPLEQGRRERSRFVSTVPGSLRWRAIVGEAGMLAVFKGKGRAEGAKWRNLGASSLESRPALWPPVAVNTHRGVRSRP